MYRSMQCLTSSAVVHQVAILYHRAEYTCPLLIVLKEAYIQVCQSSAEIFKAVQCSGFHTMSWQLIAMQLKGTLQEIVSHQQAQLRSNDQTHSINIHYLHIVCGNICSETSPKLTHRIVLVSHWTFRKHRRSWIHDQSRTINLAMLFTYHICAHTTYSAYAHPHTRVSAYAHPHTHIRIRTSAFAYAYPPTHIRLRTSAYPHPPTHSAYANPPTHTRAYPLHIHCFASTVECASVAN